MTADRRRLIVELWRIDASQVQVDPLWSVLLTKLAHST
jgi:hypothetical protein